jgi:hypothetical protein
MAVSSEEDIMNSALRKCGAELIVSQDDNSSRARLVKAAYPLIRDKVLRGHPWNFAISYEDLALVDPQPDNVFDYDYVFALPATCLRVFETDLDDADEWEEIESARLACNVGEITVKFCKKITDVTRFDANFVEALAWELAVEISYALIQSTGERDKLIVRAEKEIQKARSFDAQVGRKNRVIATDWINYRR